MSLRDRNNFTIILTAYYHDVTTLRNEHEQYGRKCLTMRTFALLPPRHQFEPPPGKMIILLESQI